MKKTLCIVLSLLLILVSFSACKSEYITPATANPDYLSEIMKNSSEYPQLTKEEFVEATNTYLSTGEWILPAEKACFYTYGVNYSAYIVDNEYLFSLYAKNVPDGSVEYDFYLSHYNSGVITESENNALHFEDFIK
ncbi:MAG: hypothetical protein E7539_02195 [Ruminococcaceae bacterium]|nr:hypothetical protein [Oscillospiraceae bacterium]